jgi:DNA invertase Pin-like site-specific DNA recombinase
MTLSAPEYILKATPGKTVGYIRVSTVTQNPERQLDGVALNKVFTDHASGKDTNRPQLKAMLEYVREGDTVIVHSIDRLARSARDLRQIVSDLTDRKVRVEFRKESLVFDGQDTAMGSFLLNVMGSFAEFERAIARERQLEGVAIAKKNGAYKGRVPAIRTGNGKKELMERLYDEGTAVSEMARQVGVSRQTVYTWAKLNGKSLQDRPKLSEGVLAFPQKGVA